jgi:Putative transposase
VVSVKDANFLVPQPALRSVFRARFRDGYAALAKEHRLPDMDPVIWQKDWGVDIKPFGTGENIIKYLGAYVCRTAIGDSRIVSITDTHVTFRWKDRANGDAIHTDTIDGTEFVKRYLRHVLPGKLRAVRYYGFCHPAAKNTRERIAFHTGRPLLVGASEVPQTKPAQAVSCPCCGEPMTRLLRLLPAWKNTNHPTLSTAPSRAPPTFLQPCA